MTTTYSAKSIVVRNVPVSVVTLDIEEALGKPVPVPGIQVTASVGETTVTETHTFGAVNGAMELPEPGHIQKVIDDVRLRVAYMAAYREELRLQATSAQ